jgi:pilus assembly protein Flp/PilA
MGKPARKEEWKMKNLKNGLLRFWNDTQGQDLVEYALAAGLVAVAAVACVPTLGTTVNNVFTKIGSIINTNVH